MIGGEIYKLNQGKYTLSRLTQKNIDKKNTNLVLKCIDDAEPISLKYKDDIYIDTTANQSARTYATLIIEPSIDEVAQKKLANDFNIFLNYQRNKYNSLFLTNYREFGRKRISFELCYLIVNHILSK